MRPLARHLFYSPSLDFIGSYTSLLGRHIPHIWVLQDFKVGKIYNFMPQKIKLFINNNKLSNY